MVEARRIPVVVVDLAGATAYGDVVGNPSIDAVTYRLGSKIDVTSGAKADVQHQRIARRVTDDTA